MKDFGNVEVHEGGFRNGVWMIEGSVTSANILGFEAGTTGYRGGDSGHGGRTFFTIFDISSSDMHSTTSRGGNALSVELGGDCELDTIINTLRAIALILDASKHGGTECMSAETIKVLMEDESVKPLEQRKVEALERIAWELSHKTP